MFYHVPPYGTALTINLDDQLFARLGDGYEIASDHHQQVVTKADELAHDGVKSVLAYVIEQPWMLAAVKDNPNFLTVFYIPTGHSDDLSVLCPQLAPDGASDWEVLLPVDCLGLDVIADESIKGLYNEKLTRHTEVDRFVTVGDTRPVWTDIFAARSV